METLDHTAPIRRRLFHSRESYSAHPGSVVIPCSQPRHRARWVLLVIVLAGLWGFGMAGQLASATTPAIEATSAPPAMAP